MEMTNPPVAPRAIRLYLARAFDAFLSWFDRLSHGGQQKLAVIVDVVLCAIATWIAFALRLGFVYVAMHHYLFVLGLALITWFPIAWMRGVYQSVLRYSGGRTMTGLAIVALVQAVIMAVVISLAKIDGLPRTVSVLQPMTFAAMIGAFRLFVRFVLVDLSTSTEDRKVDRVMIYGAGRAGQQLALSLRHENHIRVAGYLDDDKRLAGQRMDGLRVYHPDEIPSILQFSPIDEVLVALPNIGRSRRKEIIEGLQKYSFGVRALPSTARIIAGDVSIEDLRPIALEDLLGRDPVPAYPELLARTVTGKVVVVTGAGGSIGSELCRQIIRLSPSKLVLVEQSELGLYQIEETLLQDEAMRQGEIVLVGELGNVANSAMMKRLFERWEPDTVFHAAAYKHVPIVQKNPLAGLLNNVFGTLNCAIEAERCGVQRFILVSTDKAVRPTNVMGASKRACELILQALAAKSQSTIFSMVRFGNVLGSSGSVVPKFRSQIAAGGPITLTHRDVTRYFMTIPEAAQLVIQAGAMAKGGDVFVLNMGDPVRIYDLAQTMVELSGLTVRDKDNPAGDIEIREIGLRPGEKKFEELLIGDNPQPTSHPRICRAHESFLPWEQLKRQLGSLVESIEAGDGDASLAILKQLVPELSEPEQD